MALMMAQFVATKPAHELFTDRAVETTIGAAVAFLVVLLTTTRKHRLHTSDLALA